MEDKEVCGRQLSWPNLTQYCGIYLKNSKKQLKPKSEQMVSGLRTEPGTSAIQNMDCIYSVSTSSESFLFDDQ